MTNETRMTNEIRADKFLQPEAAVYGEQLAGDEVGAGGEEEDRGGDILGGAVAAHWGLLGEVGVGGVDLALCVHPLCVHSLHNHSRHNAVDADLGRPGLG